MSHQHKHKLPSDEFQVNLDNHELHYLFDEFIEILLSLLSYRDYYTYLHSLRVAELSKKIGQLMKLSEDEILTLEHGGLIHDIGKISIPDDVLLKPGFFSTHDRRIMNSHAQIGAQLFSGRGLDERLIDIALSHHERLDGSGYPNAKTAASLSLFPRIVAVADVYEALIAKRPYKPARNHKASMEELTLEVCQGKLDAEVVRALAEVTSNWSPLSIEATSVPITLARLESFRHSTYFREPLSQFYNYRYLLHLENSRFKHLPKNDYGLFCISVKGLKKLNATRGYLETDALINSIGAQLLERINYVQEDSQPSPLDPEILLLKKGADFIIYSRHDAVRCQQLLEQIGKTLHHALNKWNIDCDCHHSHFDANKPFSEALDLLFNVEENVQRRGIFR